MKFGIITTITNNIITVIIFVKKPNKLLNVALLYTTFDIISLFNTNFLRKVFLLFFSIIRVTISLLFPYLFLIVLKTFSISLLNSFGNETNKFLINLIVLITLFSI